MGVGDWLSCRGLVEVGPMIVVVDLQVITGVGSY